MTERLAHWPNFSETDGTREPSTLLQRWQIPGIITAVALGAMFLTGPLTGRVYPWGVIAFFLGMATLAVLAVRGGSCIGAIGGGLVLSIAYRLHVNLLTAPVGTHSQSQPGYMNRIVETGVITTGSPWYDQAPLHFLYGASVASVADVSAYDAMLLYSLIMPVVIVCVTAGLLWRLGVHSPRAIALVVLVGLVTTESMRRSYWVIPQVTAGVVLWSVLPLTVQYLRRPSYRALGVLGVAFGALGLTHKLPLVFLSSAFFLLVCLRVLDRVVFAQGVSSSERWALGSLFGLAGGLTVLQVFAVDLASTIVRRLSRSFTRITGSDPAAIPVASSPDAAVRALPGITATIYEYPAELMLFVERGHGIWLLAAAGLAWGILFVGMRAPLRRQTVLVLLAVAANGAGMVIIGAFAIGGLNPTRPLLLIEPVLAVLIVAGLWRIRPHVPRWSVVLTVLGILLIASQVFAASAAPDYANTPRYYADDPEAQAESTVCQYVDGTVFVDNYYDRFVDTDRDRCPAFQGFGSDDRNPLFQGSIHPDTHETVAIRTTVDVYLGEHDRWRLTWDPETALREDYHVVFDNGAVTVFTARE